MLSSSFNQFTGGIPQAIGSLCNLEELYLAFNKLTGGIPREIGNLSKLNILQLSSNGISGPIPTEIFNISSLQEIDFSNNSLTGTLFLSSIFFSFLFSHFPSSFQRYKQNVIVFPTHSF